MTSGSYKLFSIVRYCMDWEILHEDLVFLSHYISTTIILYIFRHESYCPDGHFVIKLQLQQNVPPISLLAHQA